MFYLYYNVAFKARKLSDSIMESQDSFIMREFETQRYVLETIVRRL